MRGGDPASDWRTPSFNCPECVVEDLASIVGPDIFIVDDVALPPPITFLVLPAETACGLGPASGGARGGHGHRNRAARTMIIDQVIGTRQNNH